MNKKAQRANDRRRLSIQPGPIAHLCSKQEVAVWTAHWLETFGADRFGTGSGAFLWHVFSSGRYPSVSGTEAEAEYQKCCAVEFVVLSNDRDTAFTTDQRPIQCSLCDYFVFPANLAWTMAFTHEDGWLGPYFARHPNFDALNAANAAKVEKARAAELARLKGWR